MLTDLEREHPAIVASPGGILWIDRARHLPQRRDRVCGAACKGEGTPGTSDGGRSPCERQRGRVDKKKTTLVDSILLILRAKKLRCLLCAPTGTCSKAPE